MIRQSGANLREPLSQMYISHTANQCSSRPCGNNYNLKMNFNVLDAREVPDFADSNNLLKGIHSYSNYLINIRTETS
jgi:hypothetical protein